MVLSTKKSPSSLKQKRKVRKGSIIEDSMIMSSAGARRILIEERDIPVSVSEGPSAAAAAAAEPAARASLLGGFGGIDGIISFMTKAQQMFKLFQQMGPIFKMIGAFGGAKATTSSLRSGKKLKKISRKKIR